VGGRLRGLGLGVLALAGAYLWGRRRRPEPVLPEAPERLAEEGLDPRAEALRRRLEEARSPDDGADPSSFPEDEPPAEGAGAPDERRRAVHEQARASAEEMRGSSSA
jgi:hypothetical protein